MSALLAKKPLVSAGDTFGRLTAIGVPFRIRSNRSHVVVVCRCECGEVRVCRCNQLRTGVPKSCGCLQRDVTTERLTTHGDSGSPLFWVWSNMRVRCGKPSCPEYHRYGARGISVCESWCSFANFRDWAEANGYRDGLSIDRIDNSGNYEPDNCRWATQAQQHDNRRNTVYLTAFGETKTRREWLLDVRCMVGKETLCGRLRGGWDEERAISQPPQRRA